MKRLAFLPVLALLFACSPAPTPVSQAANDPASPRAPEGSTPPVAASAAPHAHGDATYVCPMHPEVTSNGPGVCPKCNMKLVQK